jgi:exopolysaccharide biosynthesis WecB/TagA/CpsF family protein
MGIPIPAGRAANGAKSGPSPLLNIIDFWVSPLGYRDNVKLITRAALKGQGLWVLTLNLEMAARAATDPAYRMLVKDVDLTVADGMPILWLSRLGLTARRIPERSCGIDIVEDCLQHFDGRMGVLGGVDPKRALDRLAADPSRIVFVYDGPVDPERLDHIIRAVKASRCQLLFVALGVPKQDFVCRAIHAACPQIVCIGVGGSFEVLGGLIPRAPKIMRATGLEWLYRLICEPRRLAHRYLVLYPKALPSIVAWIRKMRARRAGTLAASNALAPMADMRGDRFVK